MSRLASFVTRLDAIELRLRESGEPGQDGAEQAVVAALPEGADLGEASCLQGLDVGSELVDSVAVVARVHAAAPRSAT